MNVYYLDTSAAAKRYVTETGSHWIKLILQTAASSLIITSRLLRVEMISAFTRRRREGVLSQADYDLAVATFYEDMVHQYQVLDDDDRVVDLACALMEHHPLRAYDALHLATALIAHQELSAAGFSPLVMLSADDRLLGAAQAEGLHIDNPNLH